MNVTLMLHINPAQFVSATKDIALWDKDWRIPSKLNMSLTIESDADDIVVVYRGNRFAFFEEGAYAVILGIYGTLVNANDRVKSFDNPYDIEPWYQKPQKIDVDVLNVYSTTLTKSQQLAVIDRCKRDPSYFLHKVLRVADENSLAQKTILEKMRDGLHGRGLTEPMIYIPWPAPYLDYKRRPKRKLKYLMRK